MKRLILFFVALIAANVLRAQTSYNYHEFGWEVELSSVRGYTNIAKQYNHTAFAVDIIYNYNPYVTFAAEVQAGQLSGGGLLPSQDKYGREYTNNYKAAILHFDTQFGSMVEYNSSWFLKILKNVSIGSGIGLIANNNKVQRTSIYYASITFPGQDKSFGVMIPLRLGYEFKIFNKFDEPGMAIDLAYIHNIVFGEGLDGYNDPNSSSPNIAPDQYRQIVISFKYYFGNVVSYNKLVRTRHK